MKDRQYTWSGNETLVELIGRKDQIIENHEKSKIRATQKRPNRPLFEILGAALDDDDDSDACTVCAI